MSDLTIENTSVRGKVLIIVEGERQEPEFLELLFRSFPQIAFKAKKIISYCTNIYTLYNQIITEYGNQCFMDNDDIDLPFLVTRNNSQYTTPLRKTNFTDIFLIFDYERQDPFYSEQKIFELQNYFVDSANMGKLYINYPMLESYKDFARLPDISYEEKRVFVSADGIKNYKATVHDTFIARQMGFYNRLKSILSHHLEGNNLTKVLDALLLLRDASDSSSFFMRIKESLGLGLKQQIEDNLVYQIRGEIIREGYIQNGIDYWEHLRRIFIGIIIANIQKAHKIQFGSNHINSDLKEFFEELALTVILKEQNKCSEGDYGFVWVLNTCVLLVPDYNFALIDNDLSESCN